MSKDRVREGIVGAREVKGLQVIDGGAAGASKGGGRGGNKSRSPDDDPPVLPLGHDEDGAFYFLNPAGFRRVLNARELVSRGGISGLFGGDIGWLKLHFPKKIQRKSADGNGNEVSEDITV